MLTVDSEIFTIILLYAITLCEQILHLKDIFAAL